MQYIRIAKVSDFDRRRMRSYTVLGRKVGIVRDRDGTFFATEVSCKHQNADLSTGHIRGDIVTCPRHGWTYNIRTGECLNHDSAPLRRYGLEVEGEEILLSTMPLGPVEIEEEEDWTAEVKLKGPTHVD